MLALWECSVPAVQVAVARTANASAETIAGTLAAGCRKLVAAEMGEAGMRAQGSCSERAQSHTMDKADPEVSTSAVAASPAEFPREVCPAEMPDISDRQGMARLLPNREASERESRHSLAAEILRRDPSIYYTLKARDKFQLTTQSNY